MTTAEKDIITQCQQGDTQAFRQVVERYQAMLLTLGIKMLGDEEDAKDLVQDTFLRAWERIAKFDPRYSLSTWLYTIASRLCLDRIRHQHLAPLPADEQVLRRYMTDDNAHRQLENNEIASLVRLLADQLGAKQRLVFTLSCLEGRDNQEIEQITGLSARQVKSNLYAARQTVKEQLKHLGYE